MERLFHCTSRLAALAMVVCFAGPGAIAAVPSVRTITCMEMMGGVPSEPVVYRLDDQGRLFNSATTDHPDVLLSVFGRETLLSQIKDDKGSFSTFAQHEWRIPDRVLRRRVWWVRGGRKFHEFSDDYDFATQQVRDGKGRDACFHSAYRP